MPRVCDRSGCCDRQRPGQQSDVFVVRALPRSRPSCLWKRQTTRVHRVPEWVAQAAAGLFGRSVSGLFFKDRSNSHAAHAGRTSNCTLRETFKMQVLDGGAFVGTFLVQGIECAIGVAVFTMEFLLAAGSTTIFAQIDRAAAATGDRNHTSFHSLFENLLA